MDFFFCPEESVEDDDSDDFCPEETSGEATSRGGEEEPEEDGDMDIEAMQADLVGLASFFFYEEEKAVTDRLHR